MTNLTKKLESALPLGKFCYELDCRTTRVYDLALKNNNYNNIFAQEAVCRKKCKAYQHAMYIQGKKIERDSDPF